MKRGNQGQAICADNRDRKRWLETLGIGRPTTYSGEAKRANGKEEAQWL